MKKLFEFEVSDQLQKTQPSLWLLVRKLSLSERKDLLAYRWISLKPVGKNKAKATIAGYTEDELYI